MRPRKRPIWRHRVLGIARFASLSASKTTCADLCIVFASSGCTLLCIVHGPDLTHENARQNARQNLRRNGAQNRTRARVVPVVGSMRPDARRDVVCVSRACRNSTSRAPRSDIDLRVIFCDGYGARKRHVNCVDFGCIFEPTLEAVLVPRKRHEGTRFLRPLIPSLPLKTAYINCRIMYIMENIIRIGIRLRGQISTSEMSPEKPRKAVPLGLINGCFGCPESGSKTARFSTPERAFSRTKCASLFLRDSCVENSARAGANACRAVSENASQCALPDTLRGAFSRVDLGLKTPRGIADFRCRNRRAGTPFRAHGFDVAARLRTHRFGVMHDAVFRRPNARRNAVSCMRIRRRSARRDASFFGSEWLLERVVERRAAGLRPR